MDTNLSVFGSLLGGLVIGVERVNLLGNIRELHATAAVVLADGLRLLREHVHAMLLVLLGLGGANAQNLFPGMRHENFWLSLLMTNCHQLTGVMFGRHLALREHFCYHCQSANHPTNLMTRYHTSFLLSLYLILSHSLPLNENQSQEGPRAV